MPKLSANIKKLIGVSAMLMLILVMTSASCQKDGCPGKITKEAPREQKDVKTV